MTFGQRLTEARKKKGLTQEGLGKGLGTDGADASKSVVYGWEKDQHYPRVDQLVLICDKLGCTADYLLFGRADSSGISEDVLGIANEITRLPQKQREFVLRIARDSIEALQQVAANGTSTKAPTEEVPLSSRRMKG